MSNSNYQDFTPQEIGAQDTGGTYAPMVLPFLFFVVPIIASVMTGLALNYYFPQQLPGAYGWFNLPIWYPLEILYSIQKWKQSLRNSWLSLRYWVKQKFFDQDFQIVEWTYLGKANPTRTKPLLGEPLPVPATVSNGVVKISSIPQPSIKTPYSGDQIWEARTNNKHLPKIVACLNDVPDRLFNKEGNIGMIQNGGLLFETRNIAAGSYVRCDFTKDDESDFIPIGVFTDCSKIAHAVYEERKVQIPSANSVLQADEIRNTHFATYWKNKYYDEVRLREHDKAQQKDVNVEINDRAAAMVRGLRERGKIPTSGPLPIKGSANSSRNTVIKWVVALTLISAFVIWIIVR